MEHPLELQNRITHLTDRFSVKTLDNATRISGLQPYYDEIEELKKKVSELEQLIKKGK